MSASPRKSSIDGLNLGLLCVAMVMRVVSFYDLLEHPCSAACDWRATPGHTPLPPGTTLSSLRAPAARVRAAGGEPWCARELSRALLPIAIVVSSSLPWDGQCRSGKTIHVTPFELPRWGHRVTQKVTQMPPYPCPRDHPNGKKRTHFVFDLGGCIGDALRYL
jgi:hypothetical protein